MSKQDVRSRHITWATGILCGLLLLFPAGARAQFVYVNNNVTGPNNSVSGFAVGPGGALTPLPGSPYLTGGGGSFAPHLGGASVVTSGQFLYATNDITNTIAAFQINADGSLATVPGSPFPTLGSRPGPIAVNADGTRLFVANMVGNTVAVYDIATNGALSLVSGAPFAVAATPGDAAIDSANSRLFLAHSLGVGVYTIGPGGSLTPVLGSPFAAGGSPRGLGLTPNAGRVYIANGGDDTVSGFDVGGGGALSAITGSPFAAGDTPTDVLVHPTLSVLYVSNQDSSNVSAYSINPGTGALTPLSGSPFAAGSNGSAGLAMDMLGLRLFVVNGGNHLSPGRTVSVFNIAGDGSLTAVPGSPFPTGVTSGSPGSIVVVGVCPSAPLGGCRTAARAGIAIRDSADNAADLVSWRWTRGQATTQAEFGLPAVTRTYALCVYDDTGLVLAAPVAGNQLCGSVPCWSLQSTKGILYRDKTGAASGYNRIACRAGGAGKARIALRAKGPNTPDTTLPLSVSGGVTVQFVNTDSGVCFTSSFSGTQIRKNQADRFVARVP